jgi:hypothetical protein
MTRESITTFGHYPTQDQTRCWMATQSLLEHGLKIFQLLRLFEFDRSADFPTVGCLFQLVPNLVENFWVFRNVVKYSGE